MLNKININPDRQKLIVYIVLTVVTFTVFWQVNQYDFVNFDDQVYITGNSHIQSGITLDGFRWAFNTRYADLWHPLLWISFMVDYQLIGLNAGGYHLTNLIMHILSTLLLFWLFNRMTGTIWRSAFVAAVFALHPLHVESVAWIAERKDVLSTFFWMMTLCLYVYYTEKPAIKRYLLVLFSFVLALMSKPMVITLPLVMILLDYWPLKRFESKKGNLILWQLREKIPFFILSVVLVIITLYAPDMPDIKQFSLGSRIANALVSFVIYLEKTFWPHDMAIFYPFPDQIPIWKVFFASLLILLISATVISMMKRLPYLFVGWLWYAITIAPVIGIIQVADYAMADHYHYLPSIGIAVMLAWGIPLFFPRESTRKNILFPATIAILAILAVLTWRQCGYWKNSFELWNHALKVTKDNNVAHINLGVVLIDEGKIDEAIDHYNKAIRIAPDYAEAYSNRGLDYKKTGHYQYEIEDFSNAILLKPDCSPAYINRGNAYSELGQYQRAIEDFNGALRLKSVYADVTYNNMGNVYNKLCQYQMAIQDFSKAIRLKPDYAEAYSNRGFAYANIGRYQMAIEDYNKALCLKPDNVEAYSSRGAIYAKLGQYQPAIQDLNKAIQLQPDYTLAYNNRANVYLNLGNKELGCYDARKACALGNCKTLEAAKGKGYCH